MASSSVLSPSARGLLEIQRPWVLAATIGAGLWIDQVGRVWIVPGEYIVDVAVWALFAYIFYRADRRERVEMLTVLAIATPLELFASETWRLYEYREGLMPLFVPPGHWFLFDLGRRISLRFSARWIWPATLIMVPLVVGFAWTGIDTSGMVLFLTLLAFVQWGPAPRLYVTMAWLALAMELWGTHLGNWTWAHEVPWTSLTTTNPPLLCGVFYAFGDMLVGLTGRYTSWPGRVRVETVQPTHRPSQIDTRLGAL